MSRTVQLQYGLLATLAAWTNMWMWIGYEAVGRIAVVLTDERFDFDPVSVSPLAGNMPFALVVFLPTASIVYLAWSWGQVQAFRKRHPALSVERFLKSKLLGCIALASPTGLSFLMAKTDDVSTEFITHFLTMVFAVIGAFFGLVIWAIQTVRTLSGDWDHLD